MTMRGRLSVDFDFMLRDWGEWVDYEKFSSGMLQKSGTIVTNSTYKMVKALFQNDSRGAQNRSTSQQVMPGNTSEIYCYIRQTDIGSYAVGDVLKKADGTRLVVISASNLDGIYKLYLKVQK